MVWKILSNQYLGVIGSVITALCCLGFAALLGLLSLIGLGFLVNDTILFPLLAIFLLISIYGSYTAFKKHGKKWTCIVTLIGAIILFSGIFIHVIIASIGIVLVIITGIFDIVYNKDMK